MQKKYNLALLPQQITPQVIALAAQLKRYSFQYLLGESSLPHLTLQQFVCDEVEITKIWQQASDVCEHKHFMLNFTRFSFTTSDEEIFWIALMPDQTKILHELQRKVTDVNHIARKNNYDPHMTLLNTKERSACIQMQTLSLDFSPLQDQFVLALGACDEIGQFTEILHIDQ